MNSDYLGVLLQFIETSIITLFGSVCTNAQFYLHSHSEKDPSSINIGVEMVLEFPPLKFVSSKKEAMQYTLGLTL